MNMIIPYPHIRTRARAIFNKIYKDRLIDVSGSKNSLREQLDLYLENMRHSLKKDKIKKEIDRIDEIINRNNSVAAIINSKEFKGATFGMEKLIGDVSLGLIYCIDGRIPAVFLGGRFANHWEAPAGQIITKKRISDGKLIPESSELCEALRKLVTTDKELLEIVLGHTSMIDPHHGCGAMAAKRNAGILPKNLTNEDANLQIIENQTIEAVTNIYNDFREHKGFEPLKQVCISGIYDTDSFGVILNLDEPKKTLSTSLLTEKYKDQIERFFVKNNLVFGSFKERFHALKNLSSLAKNILFITNKLITATEFSELQKEIRDYVDANYADLTKNQKNSLIFFLTKTVSLQYLTGGCSLTKKSLSHPFANHEELYMAVSTRGATIDRYDPESQGFCSTPDDAATAISNIKTKISIMSNSKQNLKKSWLLFICNPVNVRDLKENSVQLHKVMDASAELFRAILEDKDLGQMILAGVLIPVPVLIEEKTSDVLKIIDHSVYI